MTDDLMAQIAQEYMDLMGIRNTKFVICRHHDQAHPHCHIVFSWVNNRGKLISDSNERRRNSRTCKLLTQKYGLYMPAGAERVNTSRLNGEDKRLYSMRSAVLQCRTAATDWQEFEEQLKAVGIQLRFRYDNVNGRLMSVAFSDGQRSYSGKRLDRSLVLSALSERFGDLPTLAHDNLRTYYEGERERLLNSNWGDFRGQRRIYEAFPPFESVFLDGRLPERGQLSHTPHTFSFFRRQ